MILFIRLLIYYFRRLPILRLGPIKNHEVIYLLKGYNRAWGRKEREWV